MSLSGPPKRHFVVLCHKGRFDGNFPLEDLAQGRMDLKARCIQTSLFYSYGVRKDSAVTLLDTPSSRSLAVVGSAAKLMRPDERRIAELMQGSLCVVEAPGAHIIKLASAKEEVDHAEHHVSQHANDSRARQRNHDVKKFENLKKSWRAKPHSHGESCGFYVRDSDTLPACVNRLAPSGSEDDTLVLLLVEDGAPWHEVVTTERAQQAKQVVFIVGDNVGLMADEDEAATAMGAVRVTLGTVPMLTSHCIVVVHHLLDQIVPPSKWAKLTDVRVHARESNRNGSVSVEPMCEKPQPERPVTRPSTESTTLAAGQTPGLGVKREAPKLGMGLNEVSLAVSREITESEVRARVRAMELERRERMVAVLLGLSVVTATTGILAWCCASRKH